MLAEMKCPHCNEGIHESFQGFGTFGNGREEWVGLYQVCPECAKAIVKLHVKTNRVGGGYTNAETTVYPKGTTSRPVPPEVPNPYRQDFIEANEILSQSAKASAALSRRTLQAILRDKAGTTKKDLFDQIEEVIASGKLPSHFADDLHAVRNIGNFAAHEIKSKVTGAIVEVEAGEADWNLDVIESLFDFYFVEPTKAAKRKAELNKKLKEAGKPEIP
jgi:hypothetical protein